MAQPEPSRRFPIGLTLAAAIVFAVLIGLGVWQMQRLKWKQHLLAQVAAVQHAPAKPLADALAQVRAGGDVNFARVTANCPGIADAPFVELYAQIDGRPGVRLISVCTVARRRVVRRAGRPRLHRHRRQDAPRR